MLYTSDYPILQKCNELIDAIEVCGASVELTTAVTKAGELYEQIKDLIRQHSKGGNKRRPGGEYVRCRSCDCAFDRKESGIHFTKIPNGCNDRHAKVAFCCPACGRAQSSYVFTWEQRIGDKNGGERKNS